MAILKTVHKIQNNEKTPPNHPCQFCTFVRKITLYPFFALREPTGILTLKLSFLSMCLAYGSSTMYNRKNTMIVTMTWMFSASFSRALSNTDSTSMVLGPTNKPAPKQLAKMTLVKRVTARSEPGET